MSEVVPRVQQEFWTPPVHDVGEASGEITTPVMADACPGCGTEFLLGSRYCHSCGEPRPESEVVSPNADAEELAGWWQNVVQSVGAVFSRISLRRIEFPAWMQFLHFHEIKRRLGLPMPSLIAFLIGLGCVAGALLVGLLTVKTMAEWQAVQLYRVEWLLAATAAFVAGILLKNRRPNSE